MAGVLVYVTALCAVNYNKSRLSSIIWNTNITTQNHQNEMNMNIEQWFSGGISLNAVSGNLRVLDFLFSFIDTG